MAWGPEYQRKWDTVVRVLDSVYHDYDRAEAIIREEHPDCLSTFVGWRNRREASRAAKKDNRVRIQFGPNPRLMDK